MLRIDVSIEAGLMKLKLKLGRDDAIMIALATFTIVCFILDYLGG